MAQACITDCIGTGAGLGEAFGVFQGLSLGMAFMIGELGERGDGWGGVGWDGTGRDGLVCGLVQVIGWSRQRRRVLW